MKGQDEVMERFGVVGYWRQV